LLLHPLAPLGNGPAEAAGAPWHPHRGFQTVSYVIDGKIPITTRMAAVA
jgi:redox-sensitive bicupin YhaK (pirin superfamily)